jgi:hypothetical protein
MGEFLMKGVPMKHKRFIKAFTGSGNKYKAPGYHFISIHFPVTDRFGLNAKIVLGMRGKAAHKQCNKKRFHVTGFLVACYAAIQG